MLAIMETMRPQQFQDDRALAFFEHTRFSKLVAAMLTKRKTCLTSEFWRTVPWAHAKHTKDSMQQLTDLMCEMVELQSELYVLAPYQDNGCDLTTKTTHEKVQTFLSKLHDWRQSTDSRLKSRLRAKEPTTKSSAAVGGDPSLSQLEKAMCLCELGNFNMMLIYLCRFLPQRPSFRRAADVLASNAGRKYSAEAWLAMRMTPLTLPVENPHQRAYIAALEIALIWKVVVSNGLIGVGTLYLGLPMVVARDCLAHAGDATSIQFENVLSRIPDFWSGPDRHDFVI